MAFEVTVQQPHDGVCVVRCAGSLDLAHAYRFDDTVRHAERDAERCLVLDLRGLDLLDSTGVARLVAARRRAQRSGRRLALVRGSRAVQHVLQIAALTDHFEVVADPREVAAAR